MTNATSRRRSIAYDWLTPEDVARHALACYYALARQADAYVAYFPDGDVDPRPQFAEDLAEAFGYRLLAQGQGRQGFPDGAAQRLAEFLSLPTAEELAEYQAAEPDIHCRALS
jgi:hypothetical protein